MKRPKIKLEKDVLDQFLEAIAFVSLIVLVIIPIVYYYQLPEKIPLHFGADGTADRFGDRSSIWLVPIIGCIMVIGLFMLNKRPHIFNYPTKITTENAKKQYTNATKLIRILNVVIGLVFAYITFSTINIALGKQEGLGKYFLLVFFALTLSPILYFLIKAFPKK